MSPQWNELCQRLQGDTKHPLAGLAVGVIKQRRLEFSGTYGNAHFAADGLTACQPFSPSHLIRVASLSKLVTGLGLMPFVQSGRVDLQQDVSELLGFKFRHPERPDSPIRLWHLLTHTSLLNDAQRYTLPLSQPLFSLLDDQDRWLSADSHALGRCVNYSNLNFGLLACILERLSGKRFDRYMQEDFLRPNNIAGGFNLSAFSQHEIDLLAPVHSWQQGHWLPSVDNWLGQIPTLAELPVENPDVSNSIESPNAGSNVEAAYTLASNGSAFSPQGGLRTSLQGLLNLSTALLDEQRLAPAARLMSQMYWRSSDGQKVADCDGLFNEAGLASHRYPLSNGDFLWGHPGAAYGLISGLYLHQASKSALVWLISGTDDRDDYFHDCVEGFSRWEYQLLDQFKLNL